MTFFHFGNCVALTYLPYFITYKYSGLSEYSNIWKCAQASVAYFVTQLCKLLALATFFPASDHEGESFDVVNEFFKCTVDFIDLVGLYLTITRGLSGKGEVRFLAAGIGWAGAHMVATRLYPLWVGARGIEFDWKYIQMSFESNVDLIHFMVLATLIWLTSRTDLTKKISTLVFGLLIFAVYRHFLFQLLAQVVGQYSWSHLAVKSIVTFTVAIITINLYSVVHSVRDYNGR